MSFIFKLAMKKITRSPGIYIIQGIVLFIFMFTAMVSISAAVGAARGMDDARKLVGNEVRLIQGHGKLYNEKSEEITNPAYITETLGSKLLDSRYVSDVDFFLWAPADSAIQPAIIQTPTIKISSKQNITEDGKTYSFVLLGDSRLDLRPEFANDSYRLISGRLHSGNATGQDSGEAIISRLLAEKNGLVVGSTFTMHTPDSKIKMELNVVGIFDYTVQDGQDISFAFAANRIFVPLDIARRFVLQADPGSPKDVLTYISYFLDKTEHIDEFIAEAQAKGVDMEEYRLYANDTEYLRITERLRLLELAAKIFLAVSLLLCAVFMALHALFAVKKRGGEIGLMQTMGMSRKEILLKFVFEYIVVGIIVLVAAGIIGASSTSSISDYLLKEQIIGPDSITYNSLAYYRSDSNVEGYGMFPDFEFEKDMVNAGDPIDEIEPPTGPKQVLLYFAAGLFVLLVGILGIRSAVKHFNPTDALKGGPG